MNDNNVLYLFIHIICIFFSVVYYLLNYELKEISFTLQNYQMNKKSTNRQLENLPVK